MRGVPAGTAIPHRIGRHSHIKARPEIPPQPPAPTGRDYARLIDHAHQTQLGAPANGVNYAALAGSSAPTGSAPTGSAPTGSNEQLPGQLDLLTDGLSTDSPTGGGVAS